MCLDLGIPPILHTTLNSEPAFSDTARSLLRAQSQLLTWWLRLSHCSGMKGGKGCGSRRGGQLFGWPVKPRLFMSHVPAWKWVDISLAHMPSFQQKYYQILLKPQSAGTSISLRYSVDLETAGGRSSRCACCNGKGDTVNVTTQRTLAEGKPRAQGKCWKCRPQCKRQIIGKWED